MSYRIVFPVLVSKNGITSPIVFVVMLHLHLCDKDLLSTCRSYEHIGQG